MEKKLKRQLNSTFLIAYIMKHLKIDECAYESHFYQRKPKKISGSSLIASFWKMQQLGKNTLRNWAVHLGVLISETITKQSLNERLNARAVEFVKLVLKKALNSTLNKQWLKAGDAIINSIGGHFNRIMIRDSTTQQLPSQFSEIYPGSHSHGKPTAIVRIQSLFNFTARKWVDFQISPYTDNDQSAASCISPFLEKNDLILQDLGYFALKWIKQVIENQYLITKWKPGVSLYLLDGTQIKLLELLKEKGQIDQMVLVGRTENIRMRLVARKLPRAKAKRIIKEAREDRHSKTNHSEEYYELLKYEIYLTNVPSDMVSPKEVAQLYGLRWYIEILFKSWKSYDNFKKMFNKERVSLHRVQFTLYAMLIKFVVLFSHVYGQVQRKIQSADPKKQISVLKFMDVANDLLDQILLMKAPCDLNRLIPQFSKHATYLKHSKRNNIIDKYQFVNDLHITILQT